MSHFTGGWEVSFQSSELPADGPGQLSEQDPVLWSVWSFPQAPGVLYAQSSCSKDRPKSYAHPLGKGGRKGRGVGEGWALRRKECPSPKRCVSLQS